MTKPVGHTCPDGRGCAYSVCVLPGCFRQRFDEQFERTRKAHEAMRPEDPPK